METKRKTCIIFIKGSDLLFGISSPLKVVIYLIWFHYFNTYTEQLQIPLLWPKYCHSVIWFLIYQGLWAVFQDIVGSWKWRNCYLKLKKIVLLKGNSNTEKEFFIRMDKGLEIINLSQRIPRIFSKRTPFPATPVPPDFMITHWAWQGSLPVAGFTWSVVVPESSLILVSPAVTPKAAHPFGKRYIIIIIISVIHGDVTQNIKSLPLKLAEIITQDLMNPLRTLNKTGIWNGLW